MSDQDKSPDWVAGYQARCREEVETYLRIVGAGHQVYDRVIRGLVEAPTFLERETARLAVLAEAHAAELHVGRPVLDVPGRAGCPVCMEAYAAAAGASRVLCMEPVWDGPYRMTCARKVRDDGSCPLHGKPVPSNPIPGADDYMRKADDLTARCPVCDAGPFATPVWLRGHLDEAHPEIRGLVPAHNGDYGVPQNGAYFRPCPECGGCCLEHGDEHALASFACPVHAGLTANPRPGCEFHAERGDGYVVNCPACEAFLAQRAAGR